jgi:hypothetical protein
MWTLDKNLQKGYIMCVVSMIGNKFRDEFPERHPWVKPYIDPHPRHPPLPFPKDKDKEIEEIRRELDELKRKLAEAHEQDKREGNEDCAMEEKLDTLRKVCELFDYDFDEIEEYLRGQGNDS